MKHTLLEKCNADVYKEILDIKLKNPMSGELIISILKNHESHFDLTLGDIILLSAHLSWEIWDRKVHTIQFLFQYQQTTKMP